MHLPPNSVIGDYQILFDLKTNFEAKARKDYDNLEEEEENSKLMEVKSNTFQWLCDLYPRTAEKLKKSSLIKHDIYVTYLKKIEKIKSMKLEKRDDDFIKSGMNELKKFQELIKMLVKSDAFDGKQKVHIFS